MNYRINLMPDEYIVHKSLRLSRLPGIYWVVALTLLPLVCFYSYFSISAYNLRNQIENYRKVDGNTAKPFLPVRQIQQERAKYQNRLEALNVVRGKVITTSGIVEALVTAAPAGTVLTGLEINFSAEDHQNPPGAGTVSIEGELSSVELVGLYLSDLQNLTSIKDMLAKEINCTPERAVFIINGGTEHSGG